MRELANAKMEEQRVVGVTSKNKVISSNQNSVTSLHSQASRGLESKDGENNEDLEDPDSPEQRSLEALGKNEIVIIESGRLKRKAH
mmetsp:Transcript_7526/g.12707  ORF Transcript_7526/g.12707 Transcript_7526/m.12707 type:complete len:86 (-) Transcript_7526:57-314(-)